MNNVVWTSNEEILNKNFNYMIGNYYSAFEFKYNWSNNKLILDYLKRLFLESFMSDESIRKELPGLIGDVEDFIYIGINTKLFTKDNIVTIYKRLRNNFKRIGYVKSYNTYSSRTKDSILINKDLRLYLKSEKESTLSPLELRKLYMFVETSKIIINLKEDGLFNKYIETFENVIRSKGGKVTQRLDKSLVHDGVDMLEDAIGQFLGEHLAYTLVDKDKPKFRVYMEGNFPIVTNFQDNGLFQKPTIEFGRTIAGICNKSDSTTLLNMSRAALNGTLLETVFSQYYTGSIQKYYDLFMIFQNFGLLKREKSKSQGQNKITILDVKRVYKLIDTICERNLKNNLLIIESIQKPDFEKYFNVEKMD